MGEPWKVKCKVPGTQWGFTLTGPWFAGNDENTAEAYIKSCGFSETVFKRSATHDEETEGSCKQ